MSSSAPLGSFILAHEGGSGSQGVVAGDAGDVLRAGAWGLGPSMGSDRGLALVDGGHRCRIVDRRDCRIGRVFDERTSCLENKSKGLWNISAFFVILLGEPYGPCRAGRVPLIAASVVDLVRAAT